MRHYMTIMLWFVANKKELTQDLVLKAKQVEFLIQSLPQPEPEEEQVQAQLTTLDPNDVEDSLGEAVVRPREGHATRK